MDDYLMNILFAANLLEYLFETIDYPWENPHTDIFENDCQKSQFDVNIGDAVRKVWVKNEQDIKACYMELRKIDVSDKESFGKYALSAADSYFSKGYSPESFLGYCAIVLGVATFYYAYPTNGVPETAVEVIALVLLAHQLTGQFYERGGWDDLRKTSRLFSIACENSQK